MSACSVRTSSEQALLHYHVYVVDYKLHSPVSTSILLHCILQQGSGFGGLVVSVLASGTQH
jgi:hypothetical protein